MSKHSRIGGKYTGNHTTLIPFAASVCDIVKDITEVTKITPGFIKAGLKSVSGRRRVKITAVELTCSLLLAIRDNNSHQEVRVYVKNIGRAKTEIIGQLQNRQITVSTDDDGGR
jgi:hypothetical protein